MTRPLPHRPARSAALAGCAALALLPPAVRAENEFYAGIGIGYSTFELEASNFEGADFATRQFIGFNWGDYLGIEGGYINFGTVNDDVPGPGVGTINQGVETWGYNLSLAARYPLNDELDALAKAGMIRWDSELTRETFPVPTKVDGDDILWGIGLEFRGTGRLHVRVEGEFVNIDFADSWWVLTTSLLYSFRAGD
jgi:hypothetical protein